ncbi:MAG: HYR domain-containing protein [Candidatus Diapherotrites archaeon]|nr:HYR domain-containing protein [Candidatus Diapherotrites archaeon]
MSASVFAASVTSSPSIGGTSVHSPGDVNWSGVANIYASDNAYATSTVDDYQHTHYLTATGFDFSSIPTNAVITGITATIERKVSSTSGGSEVQDDHVRIIKGGVIQTSADDKASGTHYTTSDVSAIYGGATDSWDAGLTTTDIKASNFGIALVSEKANDDSGSRTVSVDYIAVTVTYTIPHTITASADAGGTISPSGAVSVADGTSKTFTITPTSGNVVSDVLVDSASQGRSNSYTFTNVTTDHTIAASFDDGWYAPNANVNSTFEYAGRAYISNDSYADTDHSNRIVEYTTFNIPAIPVGATINGIEVALEGKTTGRNLTVALSKNGGSSYGATTYNTVFASTDKTVIIGNPSTTWGQSWISNNFTDANFRVKITSGSGSSSTVSLDQLQVKVYYTSDATPPTIDHVDDIVAEATSAEGALVTITPPMSHDDVDGDIPSSCDYATGTFPLGTTTVTCQKTDSAGNGPVFEIFTVTVQDTTDPVLTVPSDITEEAVSAAGNNVSFSVSATDLVDSSVSIVCSANSGDLFPIGTTTVICTATDDYANSTIETFDIIVQHLAGPEITVPFDITVEADSLGGGTIVNFSASANDVVDGSATVSCVPASGSVFPLGTTVVSCDSTDLHGNTSVKKFSVIVQDTSAPVLVIPGDITEEATSSAGADVIYVVTAVDVVDGSTVVDCVPLSGSTFSLGTTTVDCSTSDAALNTATGSFKVTVEDTTAPDLTVPADIVEEATSPLGNNVSFIVTATDLVDDSVDIICTPASGDLFAIATTLVSCTATDDYANPVTKTFNVTVQDTIAPVSYITNPTGIKTVLDGKVIISGTAEDSGSGINRVLIQIMEDGVFVHSGIADGTADWAYTWDARGLANGKSYLIKSVAVDNATNVEPDANVLIFKLDYSTPTIDNVYHTVAGTKYVLVSGYLDFQNVDYDVEIVDSTNIDGSALYTFPVTTDENGFFSVDIDTSAWDLSNLYIAKAVGGEKYVSPTELTGLYLSYQVEALNARIDVTNARLDLADANIVDLWQLAKDLNAVDQNLQDQIDALSARVNDLSGEIIIIQGQIADMSVEIGEIQAHLDLVDADLTGIWSEIVNIKDQIEAMNHGTVNIEFRQNTMKLDVSGEAPIGSTTVTLKFFKSTSPSTQYGSAYTTPVVTSGANGNAYLFTQANGNAINVSAFDPAIYNLEVSFGMPGGGYLVYTVFSELLLIETESRTTQLEIDVDTINQQITDLNEQDANFQIQLNNVYAQLAVHDQNIIDLAQSISDINTALNSRIDDLNLELIAQVARLDARIDALDARLTALENIVDAMNHGTISLNYRKDLDRLRVKGEAPEGAVTAIIHIRDLDGTTVQSDVSVTVDTTDNSYTKDIDVSSWSAQVYDIGVEFKDSGDATIGQWVNAQFYALAVLADFQGFGFIEDKTFEYFLVLPNTRAIAFDFGAITEGQYDFNLVLSNGISVSQMLLSSHVAKYSGQEFNTRFVLPEKGNYSANLIAYNGDTAETIVSNDFNIEIVDMFDALKGEINISSPAYNDNVYSAQANTFYTNEDFNLAAVIGTTNLGSYCAVRLVGNDEQFLAVPSIANYVCSTMAFKNRMLGDLEGLFLISVESPVNNLVKADFNLGIDYTKPSFPDSNAEAIMPAIGAFSGVLHIDVNTWDTLSGVDTVVIEMIDKDTDAVVSSAYADYNAATGFWNHDFNTVFLGIPDGAYDIKTIVTDVAGNSDNRIVDPGVDNTKPVINSIVFSSNPILRNSTVTVDANVSDNFAGVKEVKAVITDGSTVQNLVLSRTSGSILSGIWSADFNVDTTWDAGIYTIVVDANDFAIPSNSAMSLSGNVNVLKNYYFNVSDQSKQIASETTTTFAVDGNFRDDLGNVPAANTILITSNVVSAVSVQFDGNGLFTITTNSLNVGTYYVDLNYNTNDYNYTARATLSVSNPAQPAETGGAGGGSGGIPSAQTCASFTYSDWGACSANGQQTRTVVSALPNGCVDGAPVLIQLCTPPATGGTTPVTGGETTPTGGETTPTGGETTPPVAAPPTGPTGLFELGANAETLGIGALAVILLGGIGYFVWKKKK